MQQYEQEHLKLVRDTAAECTLFLKTDGTFPLDKPCEIAAYGNGVRHTVKGGTGSGEVNSRFSVNIEEGLKEAGFTITTEKWLNQYDEIKKESRKKFLKDLKAEAKTAGSNIFIYGMGKIQKEPEYKILLSKKGDACVYVLSRNSGEGNDRVPERGDILLTESEERDINALNDAFDKFLLVLNVGGPVDLTPVKDVKNILLLSQLGVVTGQVLADIMLGKVNPSGKLSTTWSAWEDYCTEGDFGDLEENHYKEGIYVGYRYFDSVKKQAMYPFGFGLGYSKFEISEVEISNKKDKIKVRTKVRNTGDYNGKEVVQVYISAPEKSLDKPYQELAAFGKTRAIDPGVADTIETEFNLSDMASYDESKESYVLEQGLYVIRVGNSSVNTQIAGVISLSDDVVVLKAKNVLGTPGFSDFKPGEKRENIIPANVTAINLTKDDFETKQVSYEKEYPIDERVKSLSDEELTYLSIGAFNPKGGLSSVIGEASFAVAGAAGETTNMLKNKGIGALVMADGPAGIRVAREYYEDEKGAHAVNAPGSLESLAEITTGLTKVAFNLLSGPKKAPKGAKVKEHYATAIPIGTAIAQSFNYSLARNYGDLVGDEMERFGVDLWLAPALNIHRSIRCGRNFEYYSEDPLLSGLMAAAITEGVQYHEGCGTTVKHFAANNAETNRYYNNSLVSERAMREIYLKGFGICIRKSQPRAVMTSYNLLNGTHTSEHRGLTEDVLRCEFGYDGLVMTDWVIAAMSNLGKKYDRAHASKVAAAGGDVFMPGSKADYEDVLKALKDGRLERKQLEINATRVLKQL